MRCVSSRCPQNRIEADFLAFLSRRLPSKQTLPLYFPHSFFSRGPRLPPLSLCSPFQPVPYSHLPFLSLPFLLLPSDSLVSRSPSSLRLSTRKCTNPLRIATLYNSLCNRILQLRLAKKERKRRSPRLDHHLRANAPLLRLTCFPLHGAFGS
jgi:hypothetical protein